MNNIEFTGNDATELIRQVMDNENITQKELAERMGCVRQNINQFLNRNVKSMRYDSFAKMVSALGYEIVIKKLQ